MRRYGNKRRNVAEIAPDAVRFGNTEDARKSLARDYRTVREELDGSYDAIERMSFGTITLLDHQCRSARAILDLENSDCLVVVTGGDSNYPDARIYSNTYLLSEPAGSGKTYTVLAVILSQKIPKYRPEFVHSLYGSYVRYSKKLIPANMIVVGIPVYDQWLQILQKTSFRVFGIGCARNMTEFAAMWQEGEVAADIVLLKGSKMTMSGVMYDSISYIHQLTRDCTWARVVYDDYDSINLTGDVVPLMALSTLLVSATKIVCPQVGVSRVASIEEAMLRGTSTIVQANRDSLLRKFYNVRSADWYVQSCMLVPEYHVFQSVFVNRHSRFIKLIDLVTDPLAQTLSEMINSDSLKTASHELGSSRTLSVPQLFNHWVRMMHQTHQESYNVMTNGRRLLDVIRKLPEGAVTVGRSELVGQLKTCVPTVDVYNEDYRCMIEGLVEEFSIVYDFRSKNIAQLMQSGLECVCGKPCAGLTACCGSVRCVDCGDECVDCGVTDIVFLDGSVRKCTAGSGSQVSPKLSALTAIISGNHTSTEIEGYLIPDILAGEGGELASTRKVLVFTNYLESVEMISEHLEMKGIVFERLCGTSREIAKTCARFEADLDVMVLNSRTHCAGLNLQSATHLVFFHKIKDSSIESQVAARAQRYGRKTQLEIHYLCYDNETV